MRIPIPPVIAPECRDGGKTKEQQHSSLCAARLETPCDQLPHAPLPHLPHHDSPYHLLKWRVKNKSFFPKASSVWILSQQEKVSQPGGTSCMPLDICPTCVYIRVPMWNMIGRVVTGVLRAIKDGIKEVEMAFHNFLCLHRPSSATTDSWAPTWRPLFAFHLRMCPRSGWFYSSVYDSFHHLQTLNQGHSVLLSAGGFIFSQFLLI